MRYAAFPIKPKLKQMTSIAIGIGIAIGVSDVVQTLYDAVRDPIPEAELEPMEAASYPEGTGMIRQSWTKQTIPSPAFLRARAVVTEPFPDAVEGTLDAGRSFQKIDGFGASLAWTARDISDGLADLFFDRNKGIGLSLARMRIHLRDKDAEGNLLAYSPEASTALKAQARGARVWASPWSSHDDLKEDIPDPAYPYRGGRLKDTAYSNYAGNLVDFVDWCTAKGIELTALSPQNEPDYRFQGHESMDWTAAELYGFVSDHLRPLLDARGYPDLPIVAPELMDWHRQDGWEAFNEHPDVDILAFHNYDWSYDFFGRNRDSRFPAAVDTDKRIWQTEISDVFSGNDYTDTIADALVWARHIHRVMVDVSGSAWHWWWLVPPVQDANIQNQTLVNSRLGAAPGDTALPQMLKRGWAIGQFARFVRPGYRRIAIDPQPAPGLLLSAYSGEERLVVVAIHENEQQSAFRLTGIPAGFAQVHCWMTTVEDDLADQGRVPLAADSIELFLPPQSIVTLVLERR
jgi:glucuronoarabinoxylan endo-1,4-beta-xylanase